MTDRPPALERSVAAPSAVDGADVIAVPVLRGESGPVLGPGADPIIEHLGIDVFTLLEEHRSTGLAGEITERLLLEQAPVRRLLLVGVGEATPSDLRRAGAALARRVKGCSVVATSVPAAAPDAGLAAFIEGIVLGSYRFHDGSQSGRILPAERVVLCLLDQRSDRVIASAQKVAAAAALARTLATIPSNKKSPSWLADEAVELAAASGLGVSVWDERRLREDGFGAILAVGQASANSPRLVRLDYTPVRATRRTRHVVLVGKGITFDSGGLSIKPREAMYSMKRDMTGAAVVLAVMTALSAVGCPLRVTGLLACAENSVDGNALRPSDVIRHYGGRTTEVTNTDAEGRLVLADAMAYAVAEIKPDALVDVATLTGAIKVALGLRTGGMFSTSDPLAAAFLEGTEAAGEPFWRMPLVEDYVGGLVSTVADSDNADSRRFASGAGAILAALYLRPFTGGLPWMHLDIASVGDSAVDAYEWTPGPTGFGVRALLRWLGHPDPLAGV